MQETTLSKNDKRITRIEIADEAYGSRYGFDPSTNEEKAFFSICSAIRQCGEAARANQALIHRSFKEDGSILTETDLAVSDAIIERIRTLMRLSLGSLKSLKDLKEQRVSLSLMRADHV